MILMVLLVMVLIAIPAAVAIYRDLRLFWLVLLLAAVGAVIPWWPAKLLWVVALALACFGPKAGSHGGRHASFNGAVLSLVLIASLLMGTSGAHAITYEHHARRNWVQDNYTGQCLWKLHMDAYWTDEGDRFINYKFTKDRDNCIYHFLNWAPDVPDGGQYSYGTRWRYNRITAHFEACVVYHGVPGCTTETAVMWMKIDTDGNVQSDHYVAS